jgi:hypothetical protein
MQSDFETIISSEVTYNYTSNTSLLPQTGDSKAIGILIYDLSYDLSSKEAVSGEVTVVITPGRDDVVVHENRHGVQVLNATDASRPVRTREYEAWKVQAKYDPARMNQLLDSMTGYVNTIRRSRNQSEVIGRPSIGEAVDSLY